MEIRIEPVTTHNIEAVLPLIAKYQEFYRFPSDTEKNRAFFSRLLQTPDRAAQSLAYAGDTPVGFYTLYFVLSSLSAESSCLLNDLYTAPEWRGHGVASRLIAHAAKEASHRGYHRMEWMTEETNTVAQRLYNGLNTKSSKWLYYGMDLGPSRG